MHRNGRRSFKLVIGSQYFLYFGVLGVFLPFFNLYCYHLGFSGLQIGILSAVRSVVMVLFPLIWGTLADRLNARRPIYILCNFFLEAFTMDLLGAEKKSYGRVRAWGSISFIAVVLVLGKIIDLYSVEIIVVLILAGSLMLATISTRIPDIQITKKKQLTSEAKSLAQRRVMVFLFCAFLMLVSHAAYYGFFSIHLANLGYGSTFIGFAWALASTAEILVMIRSDQIFKRFSLEAVLIFSFMVAALRWSVLFWVQSAPAILLSQVLHALTYGAFHMASILYIDRQAPDKAKTLGQAVNNAVTYGLGLMVGFFFNGFLFEITGSFTLFIISSLIALSGGLFFWAFYMLDRGQKEVMGTED
jgi:PPP family 3-phenylpropionic acid transporter